MTYKQSDSNEVKRGKIQLLKEIEAYNPATASNDYAGLEGEVLVSRGTDKSPEWSNVALKGGCIKYVETLVTYTSNGAGVNHAYLPAGVRYLVGANQIKEVRVGGSAVAFTELPRHEKEMFDGLGGSTENWSNRLAIGSWSGTLEIDFYKRELLADVNSVQVCWLDNVDGELEIKKNWNEHSNYLLNNPNNNQPLSAVTFNGVEGINNNGVKLVPLCDSTRYKYVVYRKRRKHSARSISPFDNMPFLRAGGYDMLKIVSSGKHYFTIGTGSTASRQRSHKIAIVDTETGAISRLSSITISPNKFGARTR